MLTIELPPGAPSIYFEHHIVLWKHTAVEIGVRPMKGAFRRMMAGMQILVTEAAGPARSRSAATARATSCRSTCSRGEELHVREHQFLAATKNVDYTFERVKGAANMFLGGSGFFIDKFHCMAGDGILWLHGYGNVFEINLAAGETIDVEPGGWVYKSASMQMETNFTRLSTGLLAGVNLIAQSIHRSRAARHSVDVPALRDRS